VKKAQDIHRHIRKNIRKGNRFMGMRLFFIIVVMVELLCIIGVAWLVAWLL
jgi:hypothetical protein